MKSDERFIFSAAIGAIVTAAMYRGSLEADAAGHSGLAKSLWWQGKLLVAHAIRNAGTPDDPSPGFAKLMSFPLGLIVYGAAAFGLLWLVGRRT